MFILCTFNQWLYNDIGYIYVQIFFKQVWELGMPSKMFTMTQVVDPPSYTRFSEFNQSETKLLVSGIDMQFDDGFIKIYQFGQGMIYSQTCPLFLILSWKISYEWNLWRGHDQLSYKTSVFFPKGDLLIEVWLYEKQSLLIYLI